MVLLNKINYRVFLVNHDRTHSTYKPVAFMATDLLDSLHDCHEFIHWLSCQVSSTIYYQIVEYHYIDGYVYTHELPYSAKKPTDCIYYPPQPLYNNVKRKRRVERNNLGLYYEYN